MDADKQRDQGSTGPAAAGEQRQLMKDAVVNNLAAPASTVVGILLVPLMLTALGQDNYGLWIVATSVSGMVTAVDFGLYWSINRVVAADTAGALSGNSDFVRSAANVFLVVGLAGCVFVGAVGLFSVDRLHLPSVDRGTVALVFWLVGASLFAERLSASGFAVLAGLRRFDLINLITAVTSIAWGAAAAALLMNGAGVNAVAVAQLAVSALKGVGTLLVAARLAPNYGFRPLFLKWRALRGHASFAASSMLMDGFSSVAWNSAPVLLGLISGPAAAVPFYIGQKFPVAVSAMGGRASEVVFPAASESRHDTTRSGDVLRAGTRWVVVLVLPLSALLFVTAPGLLNAWVGNPPPGSVAVLRVMSLTVLAEAVLLSPVNLLWGRGAMRPMLAVYAVKAVGVVALTLVLAGPFGAAGAAWGMFAPIAASAALLSLFAARACELDPWKLAASTLDGLWLPVLACGITALSVLHFGGGGRLWVALALAGGGLAYLAVLFGLSGSHEEKRLTRDAYRLVRSTAAKVHFLRSAWLFAVALLDLTRDEWRKQSYFEGLYTAVDPWEGDSDEGREHYQRVDSMLGRLRHGKFRRALEVGCAEGLFTEMLARRCESLSAVDFASTALDRARRRLPDSGVRFELLDMRREPVPGPFDLIVAMDVLDYIRRPAVMKQVRDKLVGALEPGGLFLVVVQRHKLHETFWWSRMLLRGGQNICDFLGSHPSLSLVHEDRTEGRVFSVFRKGPA